LQNQNHEQNQITCQGSINGLIKEDPVEKSFGTLEEDNVFGFVLQQTSEIHLLPFLCPSLYAPIDLHSVDIFYLSVK
jgi:hypothetical protein